MARVIDDDDKARTLIDYWANNNGRDHNFKHLLTSLRAEAPNWWDDIDPDDWTTWVDCVAYRSGKLERVLVSDVTWVSLVEGESVFISSNGLEYNGATPFNQEQEYE